MNKINVLIILISIFCTPLSAQNLTDIFTNVDTIFLSGATGHLALTNENAKPIISTSACSTRRYHFSVASTYKNGKVITVGHEGLLTNNSIKWNDNLKFLTNAINWLSPDKKRITLKEGWVNNGNMTILKNTLIGDDYTLNTLAGNITAASLINTDILILGNDWNDRKPYLASELSVLENFVSKGGAILIAGLGWSWPNELRDYPMNAVAKLFGLEFTKDVIYDATFNVNGFPKLHNFYPNTLNMTDRPYCPSPFLGTNFKRGDNLRVLRLAVSTTGEFTQQNGGVAATERLIDEWLVAINEIYGKEYCVRFEIIPTNNKIIFPNAATDPWETFPDGSGGCTNAGLVLSKQGEVIDKFIGAANYDISHVIAGSPFGGGCAGGFKSGVSGGLNIPVTRHEMGHQFSQSHTINNTDKNNYEPENGSWSVQGGNAQSHAHAVSYHQLANFLKNTVPSAGRDIPTGNNIPSVNAGSDFVIPISTPFTLTGIASDRDVNDNLTYVWDNMNPGIAQRIPVKDDSDGAIFMRLLPDSSPSRTFPKMSDVVANKNANEQEQLPSQPRIMDIRLTVNDNHKIKYNGQLINASGINSDDVQLTVANAGPFEVTSQNISGISYNGGSIQVVSWNVNGTDKEPINTQSVMISLSTDGGFTYPIVLSRSTLNDGSAAVRLPKISTSSARIKVSAINNIYFDINTKDFEIQNGN
jgi:hypothetical protein